MRTTLLTGFVSQCLEQATIAVGGAQVLQAKYLQKADPTVLAELRKEMDGQAGGIRRY